MKRFTWFLISTLLANAAFGNGEIYSTNMNMPVPTVGVTTGPSYATDINTSLGIIDAHDHSAGNGVPVTPAGLNISSDLTCQAHNLTNVRTVRFSSQSSPLSGGGTDIGALYESGVDLYYNDGSGNQVRITQSGSVAGASGTITGLPSGTAGASFGSGTFTFLQATSTSANIDAGTYILRYPGSYPSPAGNYIALEAPATLATGFALTLPTTLPGTTGYWMTSTTGGVFSWTGVDNSTLQYSSNVVSVKNSGITATQLASNAVITAKIIDGAVTAAKMAVPPNLQSVSITSTQTWNVPAGVSYIWVIACGGGGGGGAGTGGVVGGGGQGAPLGETAIPVTPSGTLSITIGAAGTGSTGSNGGVGGTTIVGAYNFLGGIGGLDGANGGFGGGSTAANRGPMGGAWGSDNSTYAGQSSPRQAGGTGGTGGRGGGGVFGAGANGGTSGAGASAGANSCGGGGGGDLIGASNGGAGGSGQVQINYVQNQ